MTSDRPQQPHQPTEDELLAVAVSSLRLEGFETSAERLRKLCDKYGLKVNDGSPRKRRAAI